MNWRKFLDYDPDTGFLTRRFGPKHLVGKRAGCVSDGYRKVMVGRVRQKEHRIIWEMVHGPIPSGMVVDHINGDGTDNRLANLRLATLSQNAANSKDRSSNKSGYRGVSFRRADKKYVASIGHLGRVIHIGLFDDAESAYCAYKEKAKQLHGEYRKQ